MAKLIGSAPNQISTNGDLGSMAFEDKVSVANLNATGTKDATTFLRGDNTFAGAGKVLQVVTATDSTQRSTTSTSFVTASNTLSVSITPSSASNKIFIAVSSSAQGGGGNWSFYYTIYRNATDLDSGGNGLQRIYTSLYVPMAMSILDSPNTTSATTYQVYMRSNGGTVYLNSGNLLGTITAMEIAG